MRRLVLVLQVVLFAVASAQAGVGPRRALLTPNLNNGFLPECSSVFDVTNMLLRSNAFSTAPWSADSAAGISALVLTANATTDPLGGNNGWSLALPAVSGAGKFSVIDQRAAGQAVSFPYLGDIYVKGSVGGEVLWIMATPNGVNYVSTKITATTAWQRVATPSWTASGSGWFLQVGVDLRDSNQTAQSAQTVYIFGAQVIQDIIERPYVATAGAAVMQSFTIVCPLGVKFRDFSRLAAYSGNPVIPQNAGSYNQFGADSPYFRSSDIISGQFRALTQGKDASNWNNILLYTGTDPLTWVPSGANPVLTRTAAAWDDHFLLHPSDVKVGGSWLTFYSARDAGGFFTIGVATSPDLLTLTKYGGNPLSVYPPGGGAGIPTVGLNLFDSLLYMFFWTPGDNRTIKYSTSAANDGLTWTFGGIALRSSTSDWENSNLDVGIGVQDPFFLPKNSRGFSEMIYTAALQIGGFLQKLGYGVSKDGKNWWKYQKGPIVNGTLQAYPGDGVLLEWLGSVYLFHNTTGTTTSPNTSVGDVRIMPLR